jgi:heterodisulfide reductase subunit A
LAQVISENDINRVIVAACSPLISADVISWELGSQGFDVSCLEMANIREHCAWVHHGQGQAVTDKAVDILRMSVVRAQYHGSWEGQEQQTDKRILVVGSGITGLNSALCLAKLGFEVSLVEKESQLGGIARKIHSTIEGLDVQTYLQDLISKVHNLPNIQIYSRAEILEHNGAAGCFKAVIASDKGTREISYGASIIATGAVPVSPTQYLYGQDERVMTNLELEEHLHRGNKAVMQAENLVFIQCIGRRNHDRPYCSQICCSHSLKNVLQLKKNDPGKKIWILYQDMMTPGFLEEYSLQAAQKDVGFICYHPQNPPEIKKLKKGTRSELRVRIKDRVLDRTVELKADILALAVALVPGRGTEEATRLFHIPVHSHGFARKAESGLLPVDSWAEGVFICGMMNGPQCIPHAIYEAYAAAGRAAAFLAPDRLVYQNPVAVVDEQKCIGCGACISICAYGAIEWVETSYGKKARVLPGLCKGDGLCNTVCPSKAIAVNAFSDKQIEHQIKAAL